MNTKLSKSLAMATVLSISIAGCSTKTETTPSEDKTMTNSTTTDVQRATITIDGGKYTPNEISVEKGKPVELTFKGGEKLGCGGTIVFKSLNMTKDVESGKTVTFNFTPKEAGEIPFTCGMDMYDGKVVVK